MTKISTIYDALDAVLETALTGYTKIPNPYAAEQNNELYLTKGYGLAITSGENTNRQVCGKKSYKRTFSVPLVNKVTTTDHNQTQRESLEKSLMEDHYKIFAALETDPTLSGATTAGVQVFDSGILFLESDRAKYLLLEITIECEYFEALT